MTSSHIGLKFGNLVQLPVGCRLQFRIRSEQIVILLQLCLHITLQLFVLNL